MKRKQVFAAIAAALLVMGQAFPALAADDTTITLDSTAKQFVTVEKDLDFQNMEPGEERTATIVLSNDSAASMSFYISGKMIKNIADAGTTNKWAVYELKLTKDSAATPFFDGVIGSDENSKLEGNENGLSYLADDTLLATLAKGESSTITISLKLDGDSANNAYENQEGKILLTVSASVPTENNPGTITKTNVIRKLITAKTGDGTPIGLYVTVAAAALILIIVMLVFRRRSGKEE